MPAQKELTTEDASFESDVREVLTNIRMAMVEFVDALPGSPRRPHDISRILEIDRNLAWKVTRVIGEADAFGAAGHIPGSYGLNILLDAAARQGVSGIVVDNVRAAAERYRALIAVHAGDRASLQLLLSGQSRKGQRQAEILHRRAAFRANSFILGIQARTHLRADFVTAGVDGRFDLASIANLVDLYRIRPGAPYVISQPRCAGDDGVYRAAPTEPIDSDQVKEGEVPLLRDFSSHPTPTFRRVEAGSAVEFRLDTGPVGKAGAITCAVGNIVRSVEAMIRSPANPYAGIIALARVPCEVFIFDNFLHENLCGSAEHDVAIYSDIYGRPDVGGLFREDYRLPCDVEVAYLGKGTSVVMTQDVPRYPELAAHVFDRLGWPAERFRVYRVKLRYPFIPSSVFMRH